MTSPIPSNQVSRTTTAAGTDICAPPIPGTTAIASLALAILLLFAATWLWVRPSTNATDGTPPAPLPAAPLHQGLPQWIGIDQGFIWRTSFGTDHIPHSIAAGNAHDTFRESWQIFRGTDAQLPDAERLAAYFGSRELILAIDPAANILLAAHLTRWPAETNQDKLTPLLDRLARWLPATLDVDQHNGLTLSRWTTRLSPHAPQSFGFAIIHVGEWTVFSNQPDHALRLAQSIHSSHIEWPGQHPPLSSWKSGPNGNWTECPNSDTLTPWADRLLLAPWHSPDPPPSIEEN